MTSEFASQSSTFALDGQIVYFKSSESMDEVEDDSVDVIVTSPPYNRGKRYSDGYNDSMSELDYLALLGRVFTECFRVLKPNGVFFLNIGDGANDQGKSESVAQCAINQGFIRSATIVWIKSILGKGHYTPSGKDRRLNNLWENIFVLVKSSDYRFDPKAIGIAYSDKSNIGRYGDSDLRDAGNIWFIPYAITTGKTIKKGHEAPYPIELPYRCIKLVPSTKIVLDPFGGTCSTLAACHHLKVKGIAYEQFPKVDVIKARVLGTVFEPMNVVPLPTLEHGLALALELLDELGRDAHDHQLSKFKQQKTKQKKVAELKEILTDLGMTSELVSSLAQQHTKVRERKRKGPRTLLEFEKGEDESSKEVGDQQEEQK